MAKKVMVAMSGGVDSSTAAALLLEQGYEVCGATMKLFTGERAGLDGFQKACCSLENVEDARRVAYQLGIEHFVFNFGECFRKDVIERFASSYLSGETPNPCVDCNRYVKFGKLLERALLLGMDFLATGHYARVELDVSSGRYLLKKAVDRGKDQTYFLYAMTQEQLKRTIFPLGGLHKSEVRAIARSRGLASAKRPESQDICFIPGGKYGEFLENVLGVKAPEGDIRDAAGNLLGRHRGIIHYTVGQRRGLNISAGAPRYVVRKDISTNTVVVGDESELYVSELVVKDVNLISMERLDCPVPATVKTRHTTHEAHAVLHPLEDGRIAVRFDVPQRAAAPGQAAVFYSGDTVIGGGTIT